MITTKPHLFEPVTINRLRLDNRLVRSATWEGMATGGGRPTPESNHLYRQLAGGGVGLIVTGFTYVSTDGKPLPGSLGVHDNAGAVEMRSLTDAVHAAGGKICLQLGHAGGQTRAALCGGRPLAPSQVIDPLYPESPREMTPEDIRRVIDSFAAAAGRAKDYGFDAVQLLAAHGYLFNQFLSPRTNTRTDDFGGDLEGRSRFLLEVYRRVRQTVGADFPVLVKLNGCDFLPAGLTPEEALLVAKALDAAGVDAIEVSGGTPASGDLGPVRRGIDAREREAYHLPLARVIKIAVRCPVIVVGGIRSYWTARGIVRRGQADLIALCRPLIREPDLPLRWRRAESNRLARCISCNGCFKAAFKRNLVCVVDRVEEGRG